jgi:hypothetical protein
MRASLNFTLPDDQFAFDAALSGQRALVVLAEIDSRCRKIIQHSEPSDGEAELARRVRMMIPADLLEVLHD